MNTADFRDYIIIPTLQYLDLLSPSAVNLLLGTAAQETGFHNIKQQPGPALGFYQCEPSDHKDIWKNYLRYRDDLTKKIRGLASKSFYDENRDRELTGNSFYATAICRIHYLRAKPPLPAAKDKWGLAEYYVNHYNQGGKATVDEFIANYAKYVLSSDAALD